MPKEFSSPNVFFANLLGVASSCELCGFFFLSSSNKEYFALWHLNDPPPLLSLISQIDGVPS